MLLEQLETRWTMNASWHNEFVDRDVNRDGIVVPTDALYIINELNAPQYSGARGLLPDRASFPNAPWLDVLTDGYVSPQDALLIINALNSDRGVPTVTAQLNRDTGPNGSTNSDGLTNDPTITGRAIDDLTGIFTVSVSVNGGAEQPARVGPDGTFTFTPSLPSDGSADGQQRITVRTEDGLRNRSNAFEFTFNLDTRPPAAPSFDLSRGSDSGVVGDQITTYQRVTLVGNTEPGAMFNLPGQSLSSLAGLSGSFQLPGVSLLTGNNSLDVNVSDLAGNVRNANRTFQRQVSSTADPVLAWNTILLDSIRRDATLPPVATRTMAMVHGAVLDVVNAIEGTPSQFVALTAPAGASLDAAIAAAAHRVLVYAYPAQRASLDASLASSLAAIPDGASKTDGVALGQAAGDSLIALRLHDGWDDFVAYASGAEPGDWQPTAPVFAPAILPQWADLEPWAMSSPDEFLPAGPPALNSVEYAAAVAEVQSVGRSNSTTRTADQTQIARFWADNAGTYTPPGHWNQIAEQVAAERGNSVSENAR
ncbi:MAG TPA: Ig-like domain-containing protein, partial [Pirellulaceae bacterium]|nr:Ig-like domain-containing protein [Pirellulaceae bacterium]